MVRDGSLFANVAPFDDSAATWNRSVGNVAATLMVHDVLTVLQLYFFGELVTR